MYLAQNTPVLPAGCDCLPWNFTVYHGVHYNFPRRFFSNAVFFNVTTQGIILFDSSIKSHQKLLRYTWIQI